MAGLARIVLYRRERPVVIEPLGKGMLLTTLRYENTVRTPDIVFDEITDVKVEGEMLDLAAGDRGHASILGPAPRPAGPRTIATSSPTSTPSRRRTSALIGTT